MINTQKENLINHGRTVGRVFGILCDPQSKEQTWNLHFDLIILLHWHIGLTREIWTQAQLRIGADACSYNIHHIIIVEKRIIKSTKLYVLPVVYSNEYWGPKKKGCTKSHNRNSQCCSSNYKQVHHIKISSHGTPNETNKINICIPQKNVSSSNTITHINIWLLHKAFGYLQAYNINHMSSNPEHRRKNVSISESLFPHRKLIFRHWNDKKIWKLS